MKKTFTHILSDGRQAVLEAEYKAEMIRPRRDLDGDVFYGEPEPHETAMLKLFIDGKECDHSTYSYDWGLYERNGKMAIRGIRLAFREEHTWKRYEQWINEIIDEGKTGEVKAYEARKREQEIQEEIAKAKTTIRKAEAQKDIPTRDEALRRQRDWNNLYNEGGEGYVPEIVDIQEYERAKRILEKYQ